MTELLNPVRTASWTATGADALDVPGTVISPAGFSTSSQASEVRDTRYERDTAMLDDGLSSEDLAALSTRELRVMVNQVYKLMDTDYPPTGTVGRYKMIVEELEHRAQQGAERSTGTGTVGQPKETFRDNPLYCRFELFIDGILAAHVKYTMNGAQIVLLDGVEQPPFRGLGIDGALMRHVVLNAHKRRLGLVPQCPMALTFLTDHPQYQALTTHTER